MTLCHCRRAGVGQIDIVFCSDQSADLWIVKEVETLKKEDKHPHVSYGALTPAPLSHLQQCHNVSFACVHACLNICLHTAHLYTTGHMLHTSVAFQGSNHMHRSCHSLGVTCDPLHLVNAKLDCCNCFSFMEI